MAAMTGADTMIASAVRAGVDVCFANPGTTEMPLVAALDRVAGMRGVLGLFEGVCTGAADGYGRMTRRPALTLLHLGPGFANGIANLHNARRARTPVVNLIGDHASWHLAADAPLTSDIESLARPVSCWVGRPGSAAGAAAAMVDAIGAALARPGVASLIVEADHQWEPGGDVAALAPTSPRPAPPDAHVNHVVGRARAAGLERTGLLIGGACLSEDGLIAAARLAAAGVGVWVETFPARWERGGDLPDFTRLPYFPEQAEEALSGYDVLVLADASAPVAFFGYPDGRSTIGPAERCIPVADPGQDPVRGLEALAEALQAPGAPPIDRGVEIAAPPEGPLQAASAGILLARHMPEGAIVVEEAATSGLAFYGVSGRANRHTVLSLTGGAIGQGLPCAVGAAIACPDRKVIAFQADGSGQYTVQALWTMAREALDVLVLVCSNRVYRILQFELGRAGVIEPGPNARALTGLSQPELDWCSLARGYGVDAERIETVGALAEALPRRLAEPGPALLELVL